MPDVFKPTVRLYIPKFGKVCDVNEDEAQFYREQYQAVDEAAYLNGAEAVKANPFKGKPNAKGAAGKPEAGAPDAPPTDPVVTDPNAPTS